MRKDFDKFQTQEERHRGEVESITEKWRMRIRQIDDLSRMNGYVKIASFIENGGWLYGENDD